MYGDFSRLTFLPEKHFSAVLTQQGRVSLDADSNEQASILLRYLRVLAADIIGPHGGPPADLGFKISTIFDAGRPPNLGIGQGRYYVDGLLVENDALDDQGHPSDVTYFSQPFAFLDPERAEDRLPPGPPFLVYLAVWERSVSAVEDPDIREIALGVDGPDTAARAQVVWQVRAIDKLASDVPIPAGLNRDTIGPEWENWLAVWQPTNRGYLRARSRQDPRGAEDVCTVSPEARYRGPDNQLYRVEIHSPGVAGTATFKWSRENGSVVFPIESVSGQDVVLTSIGRDDRLGLAETDWVELVDDATSLHRGVTKLREIDAIDPVTRTVTLHDTPTDTSVGEVPARHPFLRRWDQSPADRPGTPAPGPDNALVIIEASTPGADDGWIDLEDGLQIQFQAGGDYRTGDYWLIPARTETGDVLWPGAPDSPQARPPYGVDHHFAPLALVDAGGLVDLRCQFNPLPCEAPPP